VKRVIYDTDKVYVSPEDTTIRYTPAEDEDTLLDLAPTDLIHLGGMSTQARPNLIPNGLSGCVHNLYVNNQPLGLWNFVGNEGCAPCVQCFIDTLSSSYTYYNNGDVEYSFNGQGYAVVNRIQSNTFNSRIFDMSMKFRTYADSALLFVTVNESVGQSISVELKQGKILFKVRQGWNDVENDLNVEGKIASRYDNGEWLDLRAVWVFQRGTQTGK